MVNNVQANILQYVILDIVGAFGLDASMAATVSSYALFEVFNMENWNQT